ncbi:MAG: HNH endonuclease signature motif containing protein [Acidiferrobacterales bacterium]|nr:HNH endonuclease signature motif containing protein [Acidiferrobacterales bacterium]
MNDIDKYHDIELVEGNEFVTEVDEIPIVWNFFVGLDRNDLIAELVQNDIDQDATRTTVRFEKDQLICEGNGQQVDSDGWARLRKLQGAGNSVPAKRGKIGVKNHGLKTSFTIGDEIHLSSAGQKIIQTLYAEGRDKPPRPGASKEPVQDPDAPETGCRVVIMRRSEEITPSVGEAITLAVTDQTEMDELFERSCQRIPDQFIGIVSPYAIKKFELELSHWQLGTVSFKFNCSYPKKVKRKNKYFEIFRRRCTVSGNKDPLPSKLVEEVSIRTFPLERQLKQRIPFFYKRDRNRYFVEVSWFVNSRGKPIGGVGKYRYPIGYPEGSTNAYTGHGMSFSAPIVSNTERHGPAANDSTNKLLSGLCEDLLVDTIEFHLIKRWGVNGLNPLIPNLKISNRDEIVRPLLAKIASNGAMPTLAWKAATLRVTKSKKQKTRSKLSAVLNRVSREDILVKPKYQFIIPITLGEEVEEINVPLAAVSPRSEFQLDSNIDSELLKFLVDGKTEGFCDEFITFDENDAFARIKQEGNKWFPVCTNIEAECAEPQFVRYYLDVIHSWLNRKDKNSDNDLENVLQETLLLPDSNVNPVRFDELYASAPLPSEIPSLNLPHVLHPDVANHPIFNRTKWRRPTFKFKDFIESGKIQNSDHLTKKQFWDWYCQNKRKISKRDRAKLAQIEIWPDKTMNFFRISDFCAPKDRRIAKILENAIKQPHESVLSLNLVTIGKKGKTSIRCIPTQNEIDTWIFKRIEQFSIGDFPDNQEKESLKRFETELIVLLKNRGIAKLFQHNEAILPALAKDGSIQPRNQLVIPSRENSRIELRSRFLLTKSSASMSLDKISSALPTPKLDMLLSTFKEDPQNDGALHARLDLFIRLTQDTGDTLHEITETPIIPVRNEYRSPCELAFKAGGSKPDYYGEWKIRIPGKGLSQDDQTRYRKIGVTSATLNSSTSIKFFRWLSRQSSDVLEKHLGCILHQFRDKNGPGDWINDYPYDSVIPTLNRSNYQLVSLNHARKKPVYIPDVVESLAKKVNENDRYVSLAVISVKGIRNPISGSLKDLGVRSLKEAFGEPQCVTGRGAREEKSSEFVEIFQRLNERKFHKDVMKNFDSLGVDSGLMRQNWQHRLSTIKKLVIADKVDVTYRFRRRNYTIEEKAGFDQQSGVFYVNKKFGKDTEIVCEAIARQLIFKSSAQTMHHLTLKRALEMEFKDRGLEVTASTVSSEKTSSNTDTPNDGDGVIIDDTETAEATSGHSPFEPDSKKNVPVLVPFSEGDSGSSELSRAGADIDNETNSGEHRSSSSKQSNIQSTKLEEKHKREIRDHYANHCQVCLCEQNPNILAPKKSYVEFSELRQKLIEIHHVDPKHAEGARHAGNLISLCKFHHDNFGRRLAREWITSALKDNPQSETILFPSDRGKFKLKGKIVKIKFRDKGDSISIFFDDRHADYWLN